MRYLFVRQPPLTQVPTLESVYNNIIICNLLNDHILLLDVLQMLKMGLAHTDKWLQLFKSCHLWAALLLSLKLDVCLKVKPTQLTSVQHVRFRRSLGVSVDFVCLSRNATRSHEDSRGSVCARLHRLLYLIFLRRLRFLSLHTVRFPRSCLNGV